MQATGDAGALEGLLLGVLLAGGHKTGHLVLGELDLATTESGQAEVGDLELLGGSRHLDGMEKRGLEMNWRGERCKEGREERGGQSVCKVLAANKKWPHPSLNLDNCRNVYRSSPPQIFWNSAPQLQKGLQLEHVARRSQCWCCSCQKR